MGHMEPPAEAGGPKRPRARRLAAIALVAAATVAIAVLMGWQAFEKPGPIAESKIVIVPRGAGLQKISDVLADAGVLRSRWVFMGGARLLGKAARLKAGEYEIPPRASTREIMDLLASGRVVIHKLTVPEGLTALQVLELVKTAESLDGEAPARVSEGALLPETYHYVYGDTRAALVERMAQAMRQTLAELWDARAPNLPYETPHQALIMASIVEKETGVASERPRVAAVFVNRLRRGMKLDADPTVIYALTGGTGPLDRELTRADLQEDDPYNTYRYPGLPPGPIACPGRAALEAALEPAETEDLYFVADGKGGHLFSKTLEEHGRNVARYRQSRSSAP